MSWLFTLALALKAVAGPKPAPACDALLAAGQLFHQQRPGLHQSEAVLRAAGEAPRAAERLATWLSTITFDESLRRELFSRVMTEEDVPASHVRARVRREREFGHGDLTGESLVRWQIAHQVVVEQTASFQSWWDYLNALEGRPAWLRYWAITNVLGLMPFNMDRGEFAVRRARQTAPFPELDRRALARTLDVVWRTLNLTPSLGPVERRRALATLSFRKLYGEQIRLGWPAKLARVGGAWRTFAGESDAEALMTTLRERGSGWCLTTPELARRYLRDGELHIYFSDDERGRPTQPRLAIHLERDQIAEVRGIAANQNIDADIAATSILTDRLNALGPIGDRYRIRARHMARLTEIERRGGTEPADLRFLYELDEPIEGFGSERDPRIDELRRGRDVRRDLALALGVPAEQISLDGEDPFRPGIRAHFGDIDLAFKDRRRPLPEYLLGSLTLPKDAAFLEFRLPRVITGALYANFVRHVGGVRMPERADAGVSMINLRSLAHVRMPRVAFGNVHLDNLRRARHVDFGSAMEGWIFLYALEDADDVVFPDTVGHLIMNRLPRATGVILPRHVAHDLNLDGLQTDDGLRLPDWVGNVFMTHLSADTVVGRPSRYSGLFFSDRTLKAPDPR